jgi:uncharacterized protein (DUF1800 family)
MPTAHDTWLAVHRFGVGAKPGEPARIGADPRAWLSAQVRDPAAFAMPAAGMPTRQEAAQALLTYRAGRQAQQAAPAPTGPDMPNQPGAQEAAIRALFQELRGVPIREATAKFHRALRTDTGFAERLVWFWSNHFTMAATNLQTIPYPGMFEREAIRENMTGSFADLLLATARHPGMLLYLDQAVSMGPNAPIGQRRNRGLNENYAREVMELHTIGVDAGYSQGDVTELARALTGWTLIGPRTRSLTPLGEIGDFTFLPILHEPGPRTVLGRVYPAAGQEQGEAILRDLAAHPATARRIAQKLAMHFIADSPPPAAVARLERAFRDSGGDLPTVHAALISLPEAWDPDLRKFKTPYEFVISALRGTGVAEADVRRMNDSLEMLGQRLFRTPSPEGWPDDAMSWAGPDAVMKRLEWSQLLAERLNPRMSPNQMADTLLGPLALARTREAARRAESGPQALTLLLMSPEFQRR